MTPKQQVEDRIHAFGGGQIAVGYHDLGAGNSWLINGEATFHAASTMKVCVLMELFHQAEQGLLKLNDQITILNEFDSIVDGSSYRLNPEGDSEQGFYQRIGEREALIQLAKPMITCSSNLATNLLVEQLGAKRITQFMHELGATDMIIRRGVEDGKAFQMGLNNEVTASGFLTILVKLAKEQVVSARASRAMIEILFGQTHRNCIPAKLPADAYVANKTGWNDLMCHDVAIVYPPSGQDYVLTVFTKGIEELTIAPALIADISEIVYQQHA